MMAMKRSSTLSLLGLHSFLSLNALWRQSAQCVHQSERERDRASGEVPSVLYKKRPRGEQAVPSEKQLDIEVEEVYASSKH